MSYIQESKPKSNSALEFGAFEKFCTGVTASSIDEFILEYKEYLCARLNKYKHFDTILSLVTTGGIIVETLEEGYFNSNTDYCHTYISALVPIKYLERCAEVAEEDESIIMYIVFWIDEIELMKLCSQNNGDISARSLKAVKFTNGENGPCTHFMMMEYPLYSLAQTKNYTDLIHNITNEYICVKIRVSLNIDPVIGECDIIDKLLTKFIDSSSSQENNAESGCLNVNKIEWILSTMKKIIVTKAHDYK